MTFIEYFNCIITFQEQPGNDEALFQLGKIYFDMKNYQESHVQLLKAAKLNPKNGLAFLYIGHYYKMVNNFDKAKKCYEKAFNINPYQADISMSLSDIYRTVGEHVCLKKLIIFLC